MNGEESTRREFLAQAAAGATLAALAEAVLAQTSWASATGLPTRVLGRTGQRVSILCLGGWHIGSIKDDAEAIRIMHAAIDEGHHLLRQRLGLPRRPLRGADGPGAGQDGRREKVFLMTKNCERDYAGSMRCLEDSLRRLQDRPHRPLAVPRDGLRQRSRLGLREGRDEGRPRGAARRARSASSASPATRTRASTSRCSASRYDWDTAQMPINVMDAHYRSFQKEVVPVCLQKNVGVIGMKGFGGGQRHRQRRPG